MTKKVNLRVIKGGFEPADRFAEYLLREKGFKIGQVVQASITKLRSYGDHKHIHLIGQMCVDNIDSFENLTAHSAIKRIQLEGNICCEEMKILSPFGAIPIPMQGMVSEVLKLIGCSVSEDGYVLARIPQSIAYDKMDQMQFEEFKMAICRVLAEKYYPGMNEDEILRMAEVSENE